MFLGFLRVQERRGGGADALRGGHRERHTGRPVSAVRPDLRKCSTISLEQTSRESAMCFVTGSASEAWRMCMIVPGVSKGLRSHFSICKEPCTVQQEKRTYPCKETCALVLGVGLQLRQDPGELGLHYEPQHPRAAGGRGGLAAADGAAAVRGRHQRRAGACGRKTLK